MENRQMVSTVIGSLAMAAAVGVVLGITYLGNLTSLRFTLAGAGGCAAAAVTSVFLLLLIRPSLGARWIGLLTVSGAVGGICFAAVYGVRILWPAIGGAVLGALLPAAAWHEGKARSSL